jgi:aryl-alcohol dehydrogenase-like predicted oxidoreductase
MQFENKGRTVMIYRELGNTGIKVSEIALGCEGFLGRDEKFTEDMFKIAFEHGINCMDLYSPDPDMHRRVGNAIRSRRSEFVLQAHLCSMWEDGQYKATRDIDEVKYAFETMLKNLGTDYIDIGMIHYVDSVDTWREIVEGEVMKYALELKAQGRIKVIGLSSHNPIVALEAVKSGLVQVLMFSVNPCYDLLPGDEVWSCCGRRRATKSRCSILTPSVRSCTIHVSVWESASPL